ncbi:hypothetical protein KAMIYU_60 [Mycobacterium phage Kamiyu]|nr:hypothetical protein KAMIYU_60 [Mycobacterium phage Kamiyu]
MTFVNNYGMPLWEALIPLVLVIGLIIFAAVGVGLAVAELILGGRK